MRDEVNISWFPIVAFFIIAMGVSTALPYFIRASSTILIARSTPAQNPRGVAKKIFIFCVGAYGKLIIKILESLFVNIEGVIDNNPSYYKKNFMSYKIENTCIFAKKKYKKSDLFIAVCNNEKNDFNLISNQLRNLEIRKNQIVQFSI